MVSNGSVVVSLAVLISCHTPRDFFNDCSICSETGNSKKNIETCIEYNMFNE